MAKKTEFDPITKERMAKLGEILRLCRGKRSLRGVATLCDIAPSQLSSFEKGVMTPTAEVYAKLLDALKPELSQAIEIARLYMLIRKTLPPEMCDWVIADPELVDALYKLNVINLSSNDKWEIREFIKMKVNSVNRRKDSRKL